MAFTKKNEEAVSPVIGVILMVAITVILAAVIAAFVFGMAGGIQKTKVIATTVQRTSSGVTVKYMGGQDAGTFDHGVVTIAGATSYGNNTGTGSTYNWLGNTLGSFVNTTTASQPASVMIVGKFSDGADQVIQDTTV